MTLARMATRTKAKRPAAAPATTGATTRDERPKKHKPDDASAVAVPTHKVRWRDLRGTWIGTYMAPTPPRNSLPSTWTARSLSDWRFHHPKVPELLRNVHKQGYKIVIISNQNGLKPNKGSTALTKKAVEFRDKISQIAKQLDVPFTILAATAKDYLRKPSPGMWIAAELDNAGVAVDRSLSCYVGDAAGRPGKGKAKPDFSDSDLAFALNLNVPFYVPEEVFTKDILSKDEPFRCPRRRTGPLAASIPRELVSKLATRAAKADKDNRLLVLLVGPPASGKSTFAAKHLVPLGFEHISMDTLKTPRKCLATASSALFKGTPVVIDNTNPDPAARKAYIDAGKKLRANLPQSRFLHATEPGQSLGDLPARLDKVPDVAYNMFFKRLALPDAKEGLSEIIHYPFIPKFDSAKDHELWHQFY
ncbi:PNK3P-domain-containing protein [Linderina pennispora]|uniref:PNK3P-domain-containing protein n=1 Tax=Linderina pennispora TaxID=61395 RepID=A0A1Y1W6Y9_9FUNG|nr:PNK3P-domain-containing protein [Linderina pennispora]ORX69307.1 PNK3P-domain-containing protein [Linderina pennispora]